MESLLGDTGVASSVEAALEAIETEYGEYLDEFRKWIDNQPNISWLTDYDFLNAFTKLSTDNDNTEAQNRLQRLLSSQKKHPQWFENLDPTEPNVLKVFDEGWMMLLPDRDDNGRQMYIVRFGMDPTKMDRDSWMRALVVFFDYQFLVHYKDKTGSIAILDFAGATFESFDAIMPLELLREWCQILSSHFPSQISNKHYLHCNGNKVRENTVETIIAGFPDHVTTSKVHSESLEEFYKDVPMRCLPLEYLPADYTGPNAGTCQQIIEYTKSMLTSPDVRDRIAHLSHSQWNIINESQDSPAAVAAAQQPSASDE